MPTYDYQCSQCKHIEEIFQKITDEPIKLCPQCGHETLRRKPGGGSAVHFAKGFYNTGYMNPPMDTPSKGTEPPGCCPCGKNKKSCDQKDN